MIPSELGLQWLEEMDPPVTTTWQDPAVVNRSWRELLRAADDGRGFVEASMDADMFHATVRDIDDSPDTVAMGQARREPLRLAVRLACGGTHESVHQRVDAMSPTMAYTALSGAFFCLASAATWGEPDPTDRCMAQSLSDDAVPGHLADTAGAAQLAELWAQAVERRADTAELLDVVVSHQIAPVDIHDALEAAVHRLACVLEGMGPAGYRSIQHLFDDLDWI